METKQSIQPASTLILTRPARIGFEVLLLERHPDLAYLGGVWVFPGGRIEPDQDGRDSGASPRDMAIRAAVRETQEESGLVVAPDRLTLFSCWLTPSGQARRYAIDFFLASAPPGPVRVDGGEIIAHRWLRPHDALDQRDRGRMVLSPPVCVTLIHLSRYLNEASVFASAGKAHPPRFRPRLIRIAGGECAVYQDDDAYGHGNLEEPGKRHRLWMLDSGWIYEGFPSSTTV